MRLLVVDSDSESRADLEPLLLENGHTVASASSVTEAMRELELAEFDVMFTDTWMGRQSGVDLLVEAQRRWPRLIVVVLTGKGTVESAVRAIQSGAFDYLLKPFNPSQVLRVLALIQEQLRLVEVRSPPRNPVDLARSFAAGGRYEVLLISPPPPRPAPSPW